MEVLKMRKCSYLLCTLVMTFAVIPVVEAAASESPSRVVVQYVNAAREGKFTEAEKYWAPEKARELKERFGSMKSYWEQWKEWEKDDQVEGAEVVKEVTNEVQQKATVDFKVFYKDDKFWNCRADMHREGGKWKIESAEVVSVGLD